MKDRSDDPSHHERMLLPRRYISLHFYEETLLPMRINSKALTNIFFPLGKMIGMVRLRISFIPTSQSWEMAVLLQAMQKGWSCLVSCPHRSYASDSYILRKDPPPLCEHCQCILTVRHIMNVQSFCSRKEGYIW